MGLVRTAWQVWRGAVRRSMVRSGRFGGAGSGAVWFGTAGLEWPVKER